jgi:hypothetical protein
MVPVNERARESGCREGARNAEPTCLRAGNARSGRPAWEQSAISRSFASLRMTVKPPPGRRGHRGGPLVAIHLPAG